jgi:hypothetical protein
MVGETKFEQTVVENQIEDGKTQVGLWMNNYSKNRWENQAVYPEVLIEKKALQGVFAPICKRWDISLGACKGYPSLTFLNDMQKRYKHAQMEDKEVVLLYFGDYDPSGEDIPRSIVENLSKFGVDVDLRRIALMENQVIKWKLPHAPVKQGDSRTANWEGFGQVELDAVKPEKLERLLENAIDDIWDADAYEHLKEIEKSEKKIYVRELRDYVNSLND